MSQAFVNYSSSDEDQVMLATAVVQIRSKSGDYFLARALLDSGSQINFITEDLAQKLKLPRENRDLQLIGIGKANQRINQKVSATIYSRVNSYTISSDFWVLRSISSSQPNHTISAKNWNIPENIELADPLFYKSQKVDLLLGAESFLDILCIGQIKLGLNSLVIQKTLLGWIMSGKCKRQEVPSKSLSGCTNLVEFSSPIDALIQKFWELEDLPKAKIIKSDEHVACEEKYKKSVHRLPSGRLEVSLPFKENPSCLGQSFETTKRRFPSLERKLSKDPQMRGLYIDFMKEYISLGHMTAIDNKIPTSAHYFIPHQCVLRPQSTSTKLRVVFDASSRSSSGVSLNEILMVGPTIQEDLFSTLLRFRLHKYAMTADISKMYHQILIDEADRKFQLILWREDPLAPLQIYQLNTVTYGTSPAPFLAIRSLFHLSDKFKTTHPTGAKVIRRDFYVDDMLTGADNLNDLMLIKQEVTQILESAGFWLAKWFANHSTVYSEANEKALDFNDGNSTRTLGIMWLPQRDVFKFHLETNFHNLRATKRNILSVSSQLFDPLG